MSERDLVYSWDVLDDSGGWLDGRTVSVKRDGL